MIHIQIPTQWLSSHFDIHFIWGRDFLDRENKKWTFSECSLSDFHSKWCHFFNQKHAFGNLLAQHIAFVQMKIKLKLQIFETKLKSLKSKHVHVFLYMNVKSSLISFVILIFPTRIHTLLAGRNFCGCLFFGGIWLVVGLITKVKYQLHSQILTTKFNYKLVKSTTIY